MNKPRKARVWDKRNKEWATDFYLTLDGRLYCNSPPGAIFIPDDYEISYSTGFFDADGKEIFYGDIYSYEGYPLQNSLMVIESIVARWILEIERSIDPFKRLKIKGNVYEHAECVPWYWMKLEK